MVTRRPADLTLEGLEIETMRHVLQHRCIKLAMPLSSANVAWLCFA